jgi:hypothetical protein
VASAGDFNGDGYADVLVAAPGSQTVYLFTGSAQGLAPGQAATFSAAQTGFGEVMAPAGDVNGDGYDDIIIAAPGAKKVSVYFGGNPIDTSQHIPLDAPAGATAFGVAVAGVGDNDGDGNADYAVEYCDAVFCGIQLYSGTNTTPKVIEGTPDYGASITGRSGG